MLVKPLRHAEQVIGRVLLMGQDKHLLPALVRGLPVEPRGNVGRTALLPSLEDQIRTLPFLRA